MKKEKDSKILGSLVRDELAAVETYKQALEKVEADAAEELRRIESEHEEAANLLQEQVAQLGGEPPTSSGAWGAWAKAVEGAAKLFGNKAAIKALKEGEEHGVNDYEQALHEEGLDPSVKALIRTNLLPKTRAHIPMLDKFLHGHGKGA